MFTGIVEELGIVRHLQMGSEIIRLTIGAQKILSDVKIGDSIAVNGVCLTVVEYCSDQFVVDIMPETLRKTSLMSLHAGDRVNLERAVTIATRLGGHIVSGHIDGTGIIHEKRPERNSIIVKIAAPPEIMRYIIPRGSIAIDGISLTVVGFDNNIFWVSLIPHTASVTTLGYKKHGDIVNLESDIIAKYVERMVNAYTEKKENDQSKGILELLTAKGFI